MDSVLDVLDLEFVSIIGFDGNPPKGLRAHPDGSHIVYPLGNKVVIQNWRTKQQYFLEGHNNVISSITISGSGKLIASGQINHMGFKASIIVWDFEKKTQYFKYESHKVRIESVVFSCCETFLFSLGGRDDNNVIVFNVKDIEPICGSFSASRTSGDAVTLGAMNLRGPCFLTGGNTTLKLWKVNIVERNVKGVDVSLGKIKRKFTCIEVDHRDEFAFCGTTTGDIAKVKLNYSSDLTALAPATNPVLIGCYGKIPKKKKTTTTSNVPVEADRYCNGVRAIQLLRDGRMVIGAGDGTIELVKVLDDKKEAFAPKEQGKLIVPSLPVLQVVKSIKLEGSYVTSLQIVGEEIIVGTIQCEIFVVNFKTFITQLLTTCHTSAIYDLVFPRSYSDVFATASKDDVRVWSVDTSLELLRIRVSNFTCSGICFTSDGKAIITAWNDGNIRAFTPQTGKLIYTIMNAHNKGVSAIAITNDGRKIVSGGGEGQVRIWSIEAQKQSMLAVLKEHKGPVSSLDISPTGKEAASASTDGTCIIWDLERCARIAILFSSTLFMCVRYHPSGCQLMTCGTNRQIAYWEVFDGSLIREVEGSASSALNTLDITNDGLYFATGGSDQIVKVWKYKEGEPTHIGQGHAGVITCIRVSPDNRSVVSASADGAIIIWRWPYGAPTMPASKRSSKTGSISSRRPSVSRLMDKADKGENIKAISPTQSVRVESRKEPNQAAPTTEGAVKCLCTGTCQCRSDQLPPKCKCLTADSEKANLPGCGGG